MEREGGGRERGGERAVERDGRRREREREREGERERERRAAERERERERTDVKSEGEGGYTGEGRVIQTPLDLRQ